MFNLQYEQETITEEHIREDEKVAYQVAQLLFNYESIWEDWTHPNFSMPCKEVSYET